jgi:hypothetical protein
MTPEETIRGIYLISFNASAILLTLYLSELQAELKRERIEKKLYKKQVARQLQPHWFDAVT